MYIEVLLEIACTWTITSEITVEALYTQPKTLYSTPLALKIPKRHIRMYI